METDKNMGIIKHKIRNETPDELYDLVTSSRVKPSLFIVTQIGTHNQSIFRQWTKQLTTLYKKKCPFPIRAIKEFEIMKAHPSIIRYRNFYNAGWETSAVKEKSIEDRATLMKTNLFFPKCLIME